MNPKKAEYLISAVSKKQYPALNYPSFVFLGRSNVGKSSFINALISRKNLAFTSSKPGKTAALNFYNIDDHYLFIDVPGYGYAKRNIDDRLNYGKMIEELLDSYHSLKVCFLIVDIRHDPTEDDVLMYNYLKHLNLNVVVVCTKADKISKNQVINAVRNVRKILELKDDDKCYPVSSETKIGVEKVEEIIKEY